MPAEPADVPFRFTRDHPALRYAPWLVIALAAALRIEQFVHNRSFWLDESFLGLNVLEKSTHGLLDRLDYVQSAPPGFLIIEKLAVGIFGEHEQSFRLLSLIASIAALILFWLVARRLLGSSAALLAVTLFSVNSVVLFQSSEAKPYSGDTAAALLLTWLGLRGLDLVDADRPLAAALPLVAVGSALAWLSFPSVLVLAAALAALLWTGRGTARTVRTVLLVAVVPAVSALCVYAVSSRSASAVQSAAFAGDTPATSRFKGILQQGWEALTDPGGFPDKFRGLAVLCFIVGLAVVARGRFARSVLLLGPGALALAAAAVNVYPFGGRYSLFLVPTLELLVAMGAAAIVGHARRPLLVGAPLVVLLLLVPLGSAFGKAAHPPGREEIRPLLHTLDRNWRSGDVIYIYANAQYAVRFYAECDGCGVPRYPFPLVHAPKGDVNGAYPAALASVQPSVVVGTAEPTSASFVRSLTSLAGHARLWLLFSHDTNEGTPNDEQALAVAYFDTFGRRLGSWTRPGAALYLYDTRAG